MRKLSEEPEMKELHRQLASGAVNRERITGYIEEEEMAETATAPPDTDEVMTLTEASHFLKVSRVTFYRLMKEEGLNEQGRKVGNRWRFTKRSLLNWIDSQK